MRSFKIEYRKAFSESLLETTIGISIPAVEDIVVLPDGVKRSVCGVEHHYNAYTDGNGRTVSLEKVVVYLLECGK